MSCLKKLLVAAVAFVMTATLSGCGKDKLADRNVGFSAVTQDTERDTPGIALEKVEEAEEAEEVEEVEEVEVIKTYGNLAFDFNEAVQNIYLFGQKISLPCTIKEFGEDFSLYEDGFVPIKGTNNLTLNICYKDEKIGSVMLEDCTATDKDKNSKRIFELTIGNMFTDNISRLDGWYKGGVIPIDFLGTSFYSTQDEIIKILGTPTSEEDSFGDVVYRFSRREFVSIRFRYGKLRTFSFHVE